MALMRKLFARKAMDGLSHISERVFVFNSCLSAETIDEGAHRDYLAGIIIQLRSSHPQASVMVVNFAAAGGRAAVDSLRQYGAAVSHYPSLYAGCPSLPLAALRVFLGSGVDWLVSDRQRNVLLMHCDRGAWPALAFAMAGLLAYIEEPPSERSVLEMVYRRAPMALLVAGSPALDPQPSHLRYLQYMAVLRGSFKGVRRGPFVLDCLILRAVPNFDGDGGCRPAVRVHGQEQLDKVDAASPTPRVLFSTPRIKQQFKQYKQGESAVVLASIECQIQGDIVIEGVHVGESDCEEMMFRIMLNTCFLRSNMMVFTLDDIDLPWNCSREKFTEDFKIEVFFSEMELSDIDSPTAEALGDSHDDSEPSSVGISEEFYDFDEILTDSDLNPKDHEWHSKTLQQDSYQEPDHSTEESETKASDTESGSSEEKGSISTDDEAQPIHEAHHIRESKDPSLESGETRIDVLQDGSSIVTPPIVPTRNDRHEEMSRNCREHKIGVMHQGAETRMQQRGQGVTSSIDEVSNNNVAAYGASNPQPMTKTWQYLNKQSVIIPPVSIIKKKTRKLDIAPDGMQPSRGKVLHRETMQKRILVATSGSKHSTYQAKTTRTPHKEHENANKLKHEAAQATRTPAKEHPKHSSHQETEVPKNQKQATFTIQTPPSSPPSPPNQDLNQEGRKGSNNLFETTKKSYSHSSVKSRTRRTPKQEATTALVIEAPRQTNVLKKSLSSPEISQTPTTSGKNGTMTSLPGAKTAHSSSELSMSASSSPRARKHSTPPPGRSPLVTSRVERTAQSDAQQSTSAPVRLHRRSSSSIELSHSVASVRVSNGRPLSPRTSGIMHNHPVGGKDGSTSLSPLSPRSSRAESSPNATSNSKGSNRIVHPSTTTRPRGSGAAPARPTRLSS